MARFNFDMPTDLFNGLGERIDDIIPKMLDAAAPYYLKRAKGIISASIRHKDKSTGDLISSMKMSKAKPTKNGGFVVNLDFKGKSETGTNYYKAFAMEYGNSHQRATPWIASTNSSAAKEVEDAMMEVFKKEVEGE